MRERLGDSNTATLEGMDYQGTTLDVILNLPPSSGSTSSSGYYPLQRVTLNGESMQGHIPRSSLHDLKRNTVAIFFGPLEPCESTLTHIPEINPRSHIAPEVFAPECPQVQVIEEDGKSFLEISDTVNPPEDTHYELFRDNESLGWMPSPGRWKDALPKDEISRNYAAVAAFHSSGHRSHASRPLRIDGTGFRFVPMTHNGMPIENWGAPEDRLECSPIEIVREGTYAFRLRYHNASHAIGSGVTCGVKRIRLTSIGGKEVTPGVLQFPNIDERGGSRRWVESTAVVVALSPGQYSFEVSDYFNMSYLEANATYQHKGGREGPHNRIHIQGLCIIPLVGK